MPVTRSKATEMEETLKQLMEMMQELKSSQEDMKAEMKNNQEDMKAEMKNNQEDMKAEMKNGQEDMKNGQEDMKKIQEDMKTELKAEMKNAQENMSKLEESIKNRFKDFEETIEEEINQVKTDVENKVQVIEEKVEENLTSLRNEVKKDVERIESEAEELKTEMKNLKERVVQLSTSGTIKVDGSVSSPSRMKPPTFDGKVSWGTYLRQFEAAAVANNWSDEDKARSLILALRGEAVEVLRTIPEDRQQDYTALSTALEMRYGELHLQHVYQAQLKGRRQRYDENLQQYEADIARMVSLAYPTAPVDFKEQLAVSSFIDGLRDSEISQALRLGRHKNVAEALAQALEIEAAKQASRNSQGRVRQINVRRQDQNFEKKATDLVRCMQYGTVAPKDI